MTTAVTASFVVQESTCYSCFVIHHRKTCL